MPSRVARPRTSNMAVQRSRTGCQTCRARKLKCDERRPVCGQCTKSHRECIRSEGITFRHQQNAALNSGDDQNSLENFYKYKNKFTAEQLRHFVPIPENLQFVAVHDPFEDEQNGPSLVATNPNTSDPYQQVAAHTLEALSTAAVDHPPYSSSPNYADYSGVYPSRGDIHSGYGPARQDGVHAAGHQNNNISFLLNPSSTPSSMIDPNLESSVAQAEDPTETRVSGSPKPDQHEEKEEDEHIDMSDSRVAYVLKNFADAPGQ